jgi:type VI protein secretion system component VasK
MGLTWMEWLMVFLAFKLMVAVAATLWSLERGKDRRANVCLAIALVYLAFFAWAQTRAESEHELKHAAEHRVVQEQVKSLQDF